MSFFKIIGISFIALVCLVVIRKLKDDYASIASALFCVLITSFAITLLSPTVSYLLSLCENSTDAQLLKLIFKCSGISLITSLCVDTCKDCGEIALSSRIDFCGKCMILYLSLPLIKNIFSLTFGIFN